MTSLEDTRKAAEDAILQHLETAKAQECPCCHTVKMAPKWPSIRLITWSDACACSDYSLCVFHKMVFDQAPTRPSVDVLIERAAVKFRRESLEYARTWAKVNTDPKLTSLVAALDKAHNESPA